MKVGWYYHRLRAMTVSELAHRVTERWKHRGDASFAKSVSDIALGETADGVMVLSARDAAPLRLKETLAREAEALQSGQWKLFGWREVDVDVPPSWNTDATCGVEISPLNLAHRINHRSLNGADARTIWEINRWSEMVRLGMHGWLNADWDAFAVATSFFQSWGGQNPVGYGINWTSPLEAGLRLINFTWFDQLVEAYIRDACAAPDRDDDVIEALLRVQRRLALWLVPEHAAWVWRYRSFGSSANNHLLGELVGLLHAVKRWPEMEKAICPAHELWDEISKCVLKQFSEDGGNKEQALHYHLFAWEMAWYAARIMGVTNGPVMDRLRKAAEFFVHVAHDSEQWEFGDNDDAQIVPLTLDREHAVAEWKAWMQGTGKESSLEFWLGKFPAESGQTAPAASGWWLAKESGMAVCEQQNWKLRLDASPLGFGKLAAHGHADALHLSLWDGPLALIIDPGTGGYFGAKALRTDLAAWKSHNGPLPLEGYRSPVRLGTFLWSQHHADPTLVLTEDGCAASFTHEGFTFSRNLTVSDGKIHIEDHEASGRAFVSRWLLAPECILRRGTDSPHQWLIERDGRHWGVICSGPSLVLASARATCSRRFGECTDTDWFAVEGRGTMHITIERL